MPWTYLCPDAGDQELDLSCAWQIATRKLEMMQEQAAAIEKEEQLAQGLSLDKCGRKRLLHTCGEFQGALHKLTSSSFLQKLEEALRTEVVATAEDTPKHGVDSVAAPETDDAAKSSQW